MRKVDVFPHPCPYCGKEFKQHSGETNTAYMKRIYCSQEHSRMGNLAIQQRIEKAMREASELLQEIILKWPSTSPKVIPPMGS